MQLQNAELAKRMVAASVAGTTHEEFTTSISKEFNMKSGSLSAKMSALRTELNVATTEFKVAKDITDADGKVIVAKGKHNGQSLYNALSPKSWATLRDDSRLEIVKNGFELPTLEGGGSGRGAKSVDRLALVAELTGGK